MFFAREAFGRDHLATGDSLIMPRNEVSRRLANAKPLTEFVAGLPISEASKTQLLGLYSAARDPLAGRSADEKLKLLKTTSYRDFLIKIWGCNEEVANCFQGRTLGFFGLGMRCGAGRRRARPGLSRLPRAQSARRPADRTAAASPTSTISPTATRRWRG